MGTCWKNWSAHEFLKMCMHGMRRMRTFEMSVAKEKLESGGHWTQRVGVKPVVFNRVIMYWM